MVPAVGLLLSMERYSQAHGETSVKLAVSHLLKVETVYSVLSAACLGQNATEGFPNPTL